MIGDCLAVIERFDEIAVRDNIEDVRWQHSAAQRGYSKQ
jgi:hypothetical protein